MLRKKILETECLILAQDALLAGESLQVGSAVCMQFSRPFTRI